MNNSQHAKNYLKKVCRDENYEDKTKGCFHLGVLEKEMGNTQKAKKLLQGICDREMKACFHLGDLEEKNGDKKTAIKWYKKSCYGNDSDVDGITLADVNEFLGNEPVARIGCYNLGILEIQIGNKENAKKAFRKACDNGDVGGCALLKSNSMAREAASLEYK